MMLVILLASILAMVALKLSFSSLSSFILKQAEKHIPRTLWFINPRAYARRAAKYLAFSLVMFAFTVFLTFTVRAPLYVLLVAGAIPSLILTTSVAAPKLASTSRRTSVEAELPMFSVMASLMAVSGLSLVRAFEAIINSKVFPSLSREALLIKRNSLYFNRSPIEALEEVARDHPSERFRSWILGYSSILRSGGDVASYLASKAKDFLRQLERRWMNYANVTNLLGEAVLALFLLAPMALSIMALVFASELSIWLNTLYNLAVIPLTVLLAALFIHIYQPKTFDRYELGNWPFLSFMLGAVLFFASMHVLRLELHLSLLYSSMAVVAPLALISHRQLKVCSSVERALPDFLRDVTEYRKLGFDVKEALVKLSSRRYNNYFDLLLAKIRQALDYGVPLSEVIESLKTPSWMVKAVLASINQIIESGGGSPAVLEDLTNYVNDYYTAKVMGKSSVRFQAYIGYGAPLFMAASAMMMRSLGGQAVYALSTATSSLTTPLLQGLQLFSQVLSSIMVTVVLISIAIGVIVAKVADLTFLSFRHALICLASAAIAINLLPLLL